jgi:hypothetical protein
VRYLFQVLCFERMALENTNGRLCWLLDEASVSQVASGQRTDRGGIDGGEFRKDSRYLTLVGTLLWYSRAEEGRFDRYCG